jgi:multimeric flavodoxin WrbA
MVQKITIINGSPDSGKYKLTNFLAELEQHLIATGLSVTTHLLSEKEIKTCVGCWNCWTKTPGICRHADDGPQILRDIINADLVIYASPLILGMLSAELKMFQDRTIPLLHPYIEIKNGISHHKKRYPKYPETAVLLEKRDASTEDIEMTKEIFNSIISNFHSDLKIFETIEQTNPKEISHAISNI